MIDAYTKNDGLKKAVVLFSGDFLYAGGIYKKSV